MNVARAAPSAALVAAMLALPFVGSEYAVAIGFELLMWIALTQSWTVLSGMTGYISLGHAVFYGLGAYFVVLTYGTVPLWLSLPLAGLLNLLFATAVSLPVLRVRGPYFVILTFGLSELVKYVVLAVEAALGEFGRMVFGVPGVIALYWIMLALAVAATVLVELVRRTRFGQGLLAIREEETAAEAMGIPVVRYKMLAYGLSAIIPGMVGGVMALRTTYFEPQAAFDPIVSFTILTMAIIGGSDDARGPVLGTAFLTLLSELLWARAPEIYLIILGVALIAFVLLLPQGICGWLFPPRRPAT